MSDNAISISISSLGKMYKLYRRPADKVLDALGVNRWFFWRKNYYQEFWAIRDLNLEVEKGKRLGIIGRNGAGKSTLLKIISGNIAVTEGTVRVNGRIQALMELGTGFHPEFTGRQNIRTSLSYQGFTPVQIQEKEDEIVEFAELEEFIDQPIKTYSAGMYARLAFSTATAIEPDILIIDEVLGAGDAYFSGKCVERMKNLTEKSGATVLFVSHDLGSVQQLCDRVIWIDRGRIILDGNPLEVTKAYYASILQQEEIRLKARNARLARRQVGEISQEEREHNLKEVLLRLVIPRERPPRLSHPIRRLALTDKKDFRLVIEPGMPMDNDRSQPAYLLTDPHYMNWSKPRIIDGVRVRCFENIGGKYLHAPFVFGVPQDIWGKGPFTLEVEHAGQVEEELAVEFFDDEQYQSLGLLASGGGTWHIQYFEIPATHSIETSRRGDEVDEYAHHPLEKDKDVETSLTQDQWSTPKAKFIEIVPIGSAGNIKHVFSLGETFGFRISAKIQEELPACWLVAVIYDAKGNRVCLLTHQFEKAVSPGRYTWSLIVDRPNLRQGELVASFELLPNYDPMAVEKLPYYCHWNRCVAFRIDEDYMGHISLGLIKLPYRLETQR